MYKEKEEFLKYMSDIYDNVKFSNNEYVILNYIKKYLKHIWYNRQFDYDVFVLCCNGPMAKKICDFIESEAKENAK